MSDTINEVNDLPEEDEYDELPSKKDKKKEKKEKKKKGTGGKILCLILGFFLGIFFVLGTVAGGVYYVVTRPIDETVDKVDKMTGADLYGTLFGGTDENGEYTAGILNEKYAEKKIVDLLGDVGDAIDALGSDNGSLAVLNDITPKITTAVDGIVETLEEYGIRLDTETIVNSPFKGENNLGKYIQDSMSNIAAGDLLSKFSDEPLSPLFLTICYGKENVDYTMDAEGNVTMIGGAQKKTIGELTTMEISVLFDDILLSDLIELESNYQNKILMHLTYGKEGVHYTLTTAGGVPEVTMEKMHVYVTKSGESVIYSENKTVLTGVSVNTSAQTYTDKKGNVYKYRVAGSATVDGKTCDKLVLCNDQGEELTYSPTAVGDLMGEDSVLNGMVNSLTLGELFDQETINNNVFLKHLKDEPLEKLPDAIENLTVSEIFDEETINGNVFLKHIKNETIMSLPGAIENLTVVSVYKNEIYEADGVTLKGSWKYLLTDRSTGQIDTTITVTDMQKMVDNMQANIYDATLFRLKADGVLTDLSDDMLNTPIKTSVAGVSIGVSFPGKTKLGDLTIGEMLQYVDAVLKKLP